MVVSDATPGATDHYTLTGIDPTESDPVVASGGTVLIDESRTLKARAWNGTMPESNVASAVYTLQVATPTFSPTPTTYPTPQTVSLRRRAPQRRSATRSTTRRRRRPPRPDKRDDPHRHSRSTGWQAGPRSSSVMPLSPREVEPRACTSASATRPRSPPSPASDVAGAAVSTFQNEGKDLLPSSLEIGGSLPTRTG